MSAHYPETTNLTQSATQSATQTATQTATKAATQTTRPVGTSHPGPLSGLTVVALEQAVAAPLCTARLRHAGARVIKIERASGDFARGYDTACDGESAYFVWINQGKESLALDIKNSADQQLLRNILESSDVFVQNLAPGALAKIGFDSSSLRQQYPGLITCDISGYGESEAVSHLKAYDLLVQAESGLISISGGPGEPGRIGVSLCDIGAGINAHAAILEALIQRGITQQGSAISVSLFDVAAEWMTVPFMHAQYGTGAPTRQGLLHPLIAPYGSYRTGDDIDTLVSIQNEREWARFCAVVMQNPDIASDSRFDSNTNRVANRPQLNDAILAVIRPLTADQFRQRLIKGDIAYGALNSVEDLLDHPAMKLRQARNSKGTSMTIPSHPFSQADTSDMRAPTIGEHSDSIRYEFRHGGISHD